MQILSDHQNKGVIWLYDVFLHKCPTELSRAMKMSSLATMAIRDSRKGGEAEGLNFWRYSALLIQI